MGVKLARLTEIRRQTDPAYKKAVESISKGGGKAAQKGFDALDKMGWIIEATAEEAARFCFSRRLYLRRRLRKVNQPSLLRPPTQKASDSPMTCAVS